MGLPAALQPHFDSLSIEQQIDLVHDLWNRIAASPRVPMPQWHLEELRRREAEPRTAAAANSWEAVRERLLRRLDGRV